MDITIDFIVKINIFYNCNLNELYLNKLSIVNVKPLILKIKFLNYVSAKQYKSICKCKKNSISN